jgi:peroxiredoxin
MAILTACGSSAKYELEGRITDLNNPTIYIVYESSNGNTVDTLDCDDKGRFYARNEQVDEVHTITVYYNNRHRQHFSVFPEAGKKMQITGEATFPQLVKAKGGRTNKKLSEFKKTAASLIRTIVTLENNTDDAEKMISELVNVRYELRSLVRKFIADNPNEEASVILISEYIVADIEQTEEMLNLLSPDLNEHILVADLRTQIAKARTTQTGAKAPTFKVTNINGTTVTPDSFADKYFILAFTASWCDMCRTEVFHLNEISSHYSRDSIDFLLVSLDDDIDEVREMVRQDSISWNLVTDSAGQAISMFDLYNVNEIPNCFLIDREGVIQLKTGNGSELKTIVEEIMN